MINDLNRVQLMGYVGDDAKAPQTDNAPVCFSVATTDRWVTGDTRNTRTEWHSIAVFGNLRKHAAKLKKGDRVYIEGQSRSSSYDKTVGNEKVTVHNREVIANQIEIVATKADGEE